MAARVGQDSANIDATSLDGAAVVTRPASGPSQRRVAYRKGDPSVCGAATRFRRSSTLGRFVQCYGEGR